MSFSPQRGGGGTQDLIRKRDTASPLSETDSIPYPVLLSWNETSLWPAVRSYNRWAQQGFVLGELAALLEVGPVSNLELFSQKPFCFEFPRKMTCLTFQSVWRRIASTRSSIELGVWKTSEEKSAVVFSV